MTKSRNQSWEPELGLGDVLGETLALVEAEPEADEELLGLRLADGLTLLEDEDDGEVDADGETLGLTEADGLRLALGLTEGLVLADGLTDADGDTLAETDGETEADGLTLADGDISSVAAVRNEMKE